MDITSLVSSDPNSSDTNVNESQWGHSGHGSPWCLSSSRLPNSVGALTGASQERPAQGAMVQDPSVFAMLKSGTILTGWWLPYPSEKYESIEMIIPNIWKNKTCSKPPTRLTSTDFNNNLRYLFAGDNAILFPKLTTVKTI